MWDWVGALCAAVLLGYHGLLDIKRKSIPVKSLFLGAVVVEFGGLGVRPEHGAERSGVF